MTGRNFFAVVNEDAGYTPAVANDLFLLAPDYTIPASFLKGAKAISIDPATGVAGFYVITVAGTYAFGDTAKITVESNLTSRQKFVKT